MSTRKQMRRSALLELLSDPAYRSQRDLAEALARRGFPAHQTTVTRDLKALGWSKNPSRENAGFRPTQDTFNEGGAETALREVWRRGGGTCHRSGEWLVLSFRPGWGPALEESANHLNREELLVILGEPKALLLIFNGRLAAKRFEVFLKSEA